MVLGVIAPFAAGSTPSFAPRATYRAGISPSSVAIGDLNGDGRPELVTADYGEPSRVSVFLNRGGGRFLAKHDYLTGAQPISIAIGDLNADGNLDLATANLRGLTTSVLLNRGDGSFEPKRDYRTGTRPLSVAIGDLTGDGKPEVVTANAYWQPNRTATRAPSPFSSTRAPAASSPSSIIQPGGSRGRLRSGT